ncbi:Ankyrin repeat-containing domain [Arabidopsis suecica]|uniref:Ankyrin repeat-containing domain n=1 Tax=Arabidopsis suecica TaxID=45249 RepID=A0A8T2DRT7_ARASU|nr:Ankyrin repeat-containing domain [Arabidopsis suecica]
MDRRLLWVTDSGNVDALYALIHKDPYILQNIDVLPFVHTPLHEASSTGKTDLAMELMVLKPTFAKKLNSDGFSPLHLAVENHQVQLALELVKINPDLVLVAGRKGMTPLHLVVKKGDANLLTEFLLACPESIKDTNVNGETALHIAVMNDRYEELKVLTGWIHRLHKSDAASTEIHVLNKRDRDGNTILHLAAYKNNHNAFKELLKCISLNRNIQNKGGMTALDILRTNGCHMNIKTEKMIRNSGGKSGVSLSKVKTASVFLRSPITFVEYCSTTMTRYKNRMSDGTRNALLVITALIITATYQTAVQPQDKDEIYYTGNIIINVLFVWGFNTIAFCLAIALTFILLPVGKAYNWWYIFISVPLVCSYALSMFLKYIEFPILFMPLYLMMAFVLGFLIYVFVLYVGWKRAKQKKVPEPKSELTFEGFTAMI